MGIINSSFRTLSAYLQEDTYYIPEYQREFSWEENELEDLWVDLTQLYEGDLRDHFLGQIVIHYNNEEDKKYIIDGPTKDFYCYNFTFCFEKEIL